MIGLIAMLLDHRYATLDPRLFHRQSPQPLAQPRAVHFNTALAAQLDWPWLDEDQWLPIVSGQRVPKEFDPLAMVYAGHQFGHWAGQLGDGRGLLLTQCRDREGRLMDLHLKGAGLTPYSRMGDGRAVLRSSIREYLAGHALAALGIASSQALALVDSQTPVQREQLERGAMVLRVADCHVRLGHFEWINRFAPELLAPFTQRMIEWYFPECLGDEQPVLAFARQVVLRTARMIADWQLVGFAHGVMNTDNLSITGSTLDFGPYGFMEQFDPGWINNHSDTGGRYVYQNQPAIGHWNLWVWLGQLQRLGLPRESLQAVLAEYEPEFLRHYQAGICAKMGLHDHAQGFEVAMEFLAILRHEQLDYTNSLRILGSDWPALVDQCVDRERFKGFAQRYEAQRQDSSADQQARMDQLNPLYVLRNGLAQNAILQAEQGDYREVARLFELLAQPYQAQPERARPADTQPPAQGQKMPAISCSS